MTTDSVIFHWLWTGINVGNQLWVTLNSIFYLRPVFYLLWLHLSLWLSLLPAHHHVWYQPLMAVFALGRMVSFISIGPSSYNEFHSDYLSKPLFSLGYIQHHSLYEHHQNETGFVNDLWLFYQQPTSEWSSLSLTCQRNTTCNLCYFQTTLKYHLPTHSLCFLDIIIAPNQHHSPEYPKPSCIDIIIISPICNWNPIMALSSSFHQQSPFVPVPYDQQPTHSNTLPFTTIEAFTYNFYSCHSLQYMVPITLAVIQPIRWIHDTHNVQDMFHWRWWDQRKQPLFMVESKYHDDNDGAICNYWVDGSLFILQSTR